jgi:hypothetical protein
MPIASFETTLGEVGQGAADLFHRVPRCRARSMSLSLRGRRGRGWVTGLSWAVGAVVALPACYSPLVAEGVRCDPDRGSCPRGQSCIASGGRNVCLVGDDAPGPIDYAAVVLVDHPIGYWRLGDTTPLALDTSGHGVSGTYGTGVTRGAPGAIVDDADAAAEFDGQTGVISVGSGFDFSGRAPFSIEAWIRPTVLDAKFRHVFTQQRRATPRQGYALLVHGNEGIILERFVDDAEISTSFRTMPPATSFTHIVGTYDGAFMRLYVNGELANQVTEDRPQRAIDEPTVIGAANPIESFFAGTLDEVAVYAAELPAARVHAHFVAGTAP